MYCFSYYFFFFSSRRRHTRFDCDWSSDVCSSDLDLEKITHTAKQMIMRYGMSEKLGPRVLGRNQDMPFLGREMSAEPDYSEEIAREIDDEIRRIIEEAHDTAQRVLREHMDELHRISMILIERETIDKDQFERLLAGEVEQAVFPD